VVFIEADEERGKEECRRGRRRRRRRRRRSKERTPSATALPRCRRRVPPCYVPSGDSP